MVAVRGMVLNNVLVFYEVGGDEGKKFRAYEEATVDWNYQNV